MLHNWRDAHNTSEVSDAQQLEGILNNWRDAHNTSEVNDAQQLEDGV